MKILQIISEIVVFVLAVLELIFSVQLNSTVRVPAKMLLAPVGIIIIVVVLITLEFSEIKKNREKKKKLEDKYEQKIDELKQQQTAAEPAEENPQ